MAEEILSERVMRAAYIAGWNEYVREQWEDLPPDAQDAYDSAWRASLLTKEAE